MPGSSFFRFAVDRGGTFTDVYAQVGDRVVTEKLLSEDPANYGDAPAEGIRRLLARFGVSSGDRIDASRIAWIRMGTTVATNALLQRRGAKTALLVTEGFEDLLRIGDQTRPELFSLEIPPRPVLYDAVVGVRERVRPGDDGAFVVERPLDEAHAAEALRRLRAEGYESLAVSLMHAYGFDAHEKRLEVLAREAGFAQVSLSSQTAGSVGYTARTQSTAVDAYLTPEVRRYVAGFKSAFTGSIENTPVDFMQSFGGLCDAEAFRGIDAVLSGPAGGVVALASMYEGTPLIGFDMGGTSTDVCRYDGRFDIGFDQHTAGVGYRAAQLRIETVAAGGGSRLFYEHGMFRVGPESAGAHPGPVCYRKGGPLTVTDANVLLGRVQPDFFPRVFGENGDEPLDVAAVREAFAELAERINADRDTPLTVEEIALAFVRVANDNMARPVEAVSTKKGFALRDHVLVPFGGAGAQHACAVARALGIGSVLVHRDAGVLCAYGLSRAARIDRRSVSVRRPLASFSAAELDALFVPLCEDGGECRRLLLMRYEGSERQFLIPLSDDPAAAFEAAHRREFGFVPRTPVIVDEAQTEIVRRTEALSRPQPGECPPPEPAAFRPVRFEEGTYDTPVYDGALFGPGHRIEGPAVISAQTSTIVIEPGCSARVDAYGDWHIRVGGASSAMPTEASDPRWLPIFANLFASVAQQMGYALERTAVSTNIRERLDFSCAVFDAHGDLVANAPHIPVHLGAMSETVREMFSRFAGEMEPGDVYVSNAPFEGGSHLPDITVITPLIENGRLRGAVASRGHHADIGGVTPGSMPPDSASLSQEGALITLRRIVHRGVFDEAGLRRLFGKAGARRVGENLADIRAQIAANRKGIALLEAASERYGAAVVDAYEGHLRGVSETAMRSKLRELAARRGTRLHARDRLDDGSVIDLAVSIDPEAGSAVFDFTASADAQAAGNQNTPSAIVRSAVVYALRTLVDEDLPLNGGFLAPVTLELRRGSLLDPPPDAAVVGGNVTTSQRVVDVIFQAFGAAADSCGCMNNVTFGTEDFGYYETVGGGAGATPDAPGASGVHTHMTNTRITDPEVLENRYPVVLERFALRRGSGGAGRHRGGDGLVRRIRFLTPMRVSLLTERRRFAPGGLDGGEAGARGENLLIRGEETVPLAGKASLEVEAGDVLEIRTPGGGGCGRAEG